jgi:hypothetical protein
LNFILFSTCRLYHVGFPGPQEIVIFFEDRDIHALHKKTRKNAIFFKHGVNARSNDALTINLQQTVSLFNDFKAEADLEGDFVVATETEEFEKDGTEGLIGASVTRDGRGRGKGRGKGRGFRRGLGGSLGSGVG